MDGPNLQGLLAMALLSRLFVLAALATASSALYTGQPLHYIDEAEPY